MKEIKTQEDLLIEWNKWVRKLLLGKTVTGQMNKIQKVLPDGYESHGNNWENYTVYVKEVIPNENMDDPVIPIIGLDEKEEAWRYFIPIDNKKIYIENES